jgi:hypothetical protein
MPLTEHLRFKYGSNTCGYGSLFMFIGGAALLLVASRAYAARKGHHPSLGWLGLLSVVGLILLVWICRSDPRR